MKVCPSCGRVVSYNSYFGTYLCANCNWEDRQIRKMNAKHCFKPGDTAFFIEPILRAAHKCTIMECTTDTETGKLLYKIHDDTQYGTLTVLDQNVFSFEEDAKSAIYAEDHKNLMAFKENIQSIDDLIAFPLDHCLVGDYYDPIARLAYTLRAQELGFVLEGENKNG